MRHTIQTATIIGVTVLALICGCRPDADRTIKEASTPEQGYPQTEVCQPENSDTLGTKTARRPDVQIRVLKGSALFLETEGLRLTAIGNAVQHSGVYSVTSLVGDELPPLPQGMVNMTAATSGYRLLPSGDHFSPAAELRVSYDPERLPEGYTPNDIHTSYFDSTAMAWVRLERVEVDTVNCEIVSLTTHFTDFINELLKAPEMPETQAFVPTAMSDLEAANPMEGMSLMQPPSPSQSGAAELNYPFDIPAGRNGMQPSIALTYNSDGGNGWLGEGWDIPIPAITIDTRWGAPRYDGDKESETYMYKGEQLVAKDIKNNFILMPHRTSLWSDRLGDGTQFFPRVNEAFDSIVRHGKTPSTYWWEVFDRNGVIHRYGHYETLDNDTNQSILRDNKGNIAKWCLAESEDAYGNMVRYLYDTVQCSGIEGSLVKGRQIYPSEIHYTLYRKQGGQVIDTGFHRIIFFREDNDRARKHSYKVFQDHNIQTDLPQHIPAIISGRNGFKEVTASLLSFIRISSGDTTNRIYHFGMEMDETTNYKVVLKNVFSSTKQGMEGYADKGVFYRGDLYGDWLNFEYVTSEDEIFGPGVVMDNEWNNRGYAFDVGVTSFVGDAVSVAGKSLSTSALSMSKGFNWNVGGGVSVGLGYNVFWTELAAGGNYSYNHSDDCGALTLIDLDGDGLADKVFKDIWGNVYYRKHIRMDNGIFVYGPAIRLREIDDFQKTTSHSHDVGLQVSIGVSATGSRNWGKCYTSIYFSDVNADGLPDLVTDVGVYFNDLVNGIPEFHRTRNHFNPNLKDTVYTSTMPCGYIIYDGKLNDSIYCSTKRYEKVKEYRNTDVVDSGIVVDFIDSNYVIDDITNTTVTGHRDIIDCTQRSYRTGGADGIGGWNIDPNMEAVKVWVAPYPGTITVADTIRMQPDRTGGLRRSRYADGIAYSVQWNKGVSPIDDTALSCTSETRIQSLSGELLSTDTSFIINDTIFTVAQGDILFFRLQSGHSRLFDRVDWKHGIEYNGVSSALDAYGRPFNKYVSSQDYVVEGEDFFQAPSAGYLILDIEVKTGTLQTLTTPNEITLYVQYNSYSPWSYRVPANYNNIIHVNPYANPYNLISVNGGDSVKVWITADNNYTTWGNVKCRPHYRFIPCANSNVKDTLDWWIAPKIPALNLFANNAYKNLFGSLYRGWGQFSYMADGTTPDDVIHLSSLRCGKIASAEGLDETEMRGIGDFFNPNDYYNIDFNTISSAITASGNYNPLSTTADSRWRRMEADCRHQAWLGYGRTTAITDTMAANVCPKEFYAEGKAADIMDMDCPATASTEEYPKVKTHAKYSESRTDNISFSAEIGHVTPGFSRSSGYSNTFADYVDLNGDRYPDLLGEGAVQLTMPYGGLENNVRVILGNSSENGTHSNSSSVSVGDNPQKPQKMFGKVSAASKTESVPDKPESHGATVSIVTGSDTARFALTDINGDGLPDKVFDNGTVALNIGYCFLTPEPWLCVGTHWGHYYSGSGSASQSTSLKPPFNLEKFSIGGGRSVGFSDNYTDFQLMDINGDGLPDRVNVDNNANTLEVYINLGGGLWKDTRAYVSNISHGISFNESVNASVTAGLTVLFAKVTGTISGTPMGRNFSGETAQFMDVDGDGFVDYVTSGGENKMTVRYNTLARVNQLKKVHNFNFSTFEMDYTFIPPTYSQPQGQWVLSSCRVTGDAAKGVPDSYTTYSYRNPHYDRYERMSFGYDTVITCQHIQNAAGNYRPYRYIIEGYHNDSYQMRGKKRSECIVDSNNRRWEETLFDVVVVDLENGDTIGERECPLVSFPLLEKTITNHYEGLVSVQMTTAKSFLYDEYRNVKAYINWGDTNFTGDELRADIAYLTHRARNQISLRSDVTVRAGRLYTSPTIRKSRFTYNNNGLPITRTDYIDNTNVAITDYEYDSYGNVSQVTLPENATGQRMWYSYTYDPVLHRLPIQTDDAFGRHSYATYSYCYGKPFTVTDVAGNTMRYKYDLWGRVTSITAPREHTNGELYTWKAEYNNGYWARTYHFDTLHSNDPIETMTFCDPWGRIIQVKKDLVVNGTDVIQVSGKTQYDAVGRAVLQYDPTIENTGNLQIYNTSSTALRTATIYDILDRTVQCSTYHNSGILVQTSAFAYTGTSFGTMLETAVTDPLLRTVTSMTDAYGRTVSFTDALGGTTKNEYDAIGQLLQSSDPEGFVTSYEYDLLGRVTSRDHPDAGQTLTKYDPAGNIVMQTNANGETVSYVYNYNRPEEKHYSKFPDNDVYYGYNNFGQLSDIQDGSETQQLFYDELGNISKNVRTFAVPYSDNTYTFTMEYRYDSWGRMLWMAYPDGEKVCYDYDHSGNLYSMEGTKNNINHRYIDIVLYDHFGNRIKIEYGNHCHTEYTYDDLQRLIGLKTYAFAGGNEVEIQDISYSFDDVGNITDAANTANSVGILGGTYSNHYQYDNNDRLTDASQTFGAGNILNARYSPSGRLCKKSQSFSAQNAFFEYDNHDKPHAPRWINNPDRELLHNLQWDECGNMAQVDEYLLPDGVLNSSRYLYWTEDNRLTNVVDEKYFSYYAYDHSGERILKMTGGNTLIDINADVAQYYSIVDNITLYTSPYLVANNNGYTKHYYAGTERVCASIGNGNLNSNSNFISQEQEITSRSTSLYDASLESMHQRHLSDNSLTDITDICDNTPFVFPDFSEMAPTDVDAESVVITDLFEDAMDTYASTTQQQEEPFYYHSDHLGSASWITDANGQPVQHLQYLPFGESFINQHTSGYEERFTFTGKEKDSETGFYYFSARYYDPSLSGLFISVDPMSDKYPSISPYAYCAWNPVKLVDPDGKDTVFVDDEARKTFNSVYANIYQRLNDLESRNISDDEYSNLMEMKAVLDDVISSGTKFYYSTLSNKNDRGDIILNNGSTYGKEGVDGINIEFVSMSEETFIHESRHAAGYVRGEWNFDKSNIDENGNYGLVNYDLMDEFEAYRMENNYSVWLRNGEYKEDWQIKQDVDRYKNYPHVIPEYVQYTNINPYRK